MPNKKVIIATVPRPSRFVEFMGYTSDKAEVQKRFKIIQEAIEANGLSIGSIDHLLLHCHSYSMSGDKRIVVPRTYIYTGRECGVEAKRNQHDPTGLGDLGWGVEIYTRWHQENVLSGQTDHLIAVTSSRDLQKVVEAFEYSRYSQKTV